MQPLKFRNGYVISSHALLGIIMAMVTQDRPTKNIYLRRRRTFGSIRRFINKKCNGNLHHWRHRFVSLSETQQTILNTVTRLWLLVWNGLIELDDLWSDLDAMLLIRNRLFIAVVHITYVWGNVMHYVRYVFFHWLSLILVRLNPYIDTAPWLTCFNITMTS